MAGPSEVLTTMTSRLLAGTGPYAFESRGEQQLKGLPDPIELFLVRAT
jgi:hypothetical protein